MYIYGGNMESNAAVQHFSDSQVYTVPYAREYDCLFYI